MYKNYKNIVKNRVTSPVQQFIRNEKAGGIVLAISVVLAMLLANLPLKEHYFSFFEQTFGFTFNGKSYLNFNLYHWINDGLMAIFFFVVGLSLKREFIAGELSNMRKAVLPIGAAINGMIVPAVIYLSLNLSDSASRGWGIPIATDIAFALGVLYLLGNRIPLSIKVFLMALAIVDDLGAVLVIALFYTSNISILSLSIGLGCVFVMFIANKMGVKNVIFYAILGIGGVWIAFLMSGVHATIAAVLAAFTIPGDARMNEKLYSDKISTLLKQFKETDINNKPTLENNQVALLDEIRNHTTAVIPPLQRLEHAMHPLVAFVIMPIFAIANAGVSFTDVTLNTLFSTNVAGGVFAGLLFGKFIGVVGSSYLMIRLKIAKPLVGMTIRNLLGVGCLASIGFTMSMFITTLAFSDANHLLQAKVGIFSASLLGGFIGYLLLRKRA